LARLGGQLEAAGRVRAGTAYKVTVNLMGAAQATALAEGLLVAEKAGLDMAQPAVQQGFGGFGSFSHARFLPLPIGASLSQRRCPAP
jgi:3-hydroxyisobutyrate dehydrogenase-like beta-hydroxyacid dehydrogenase